MRSSYKQKQPLLTVTVKCKLKFEADYFDLKKNMVAKLLSLPLIFNFYSHDSWIHEIHNSWIHEIHNHERWNSWFLFKKQLKDGKQIFKKLLK